MKAAPCSCRVSTSLIEEFLRLSTMSRFSSPGTPKMRSTPSFSSAATIRSEPLGMLPPIPAIGSRRPDLLNAEENHIHWLVARTERLPALSKFASDSGGHHARLETVWHFPVLANGFIPQVDLSFSS